MSQTLSRVILVTGANSGIGFELVRILAEKKHTVYLGARNEAAGREAEKQLHAEGLMTVKFVRIDVTDISIVQSAKETIEKTEGKLDVLVNNAGTNIATDGNQNHAAASISIATLREIFEVNYFGVAQTTIAFLPLIRKSTCGGVIVNVSSSLGSGSLNSEKHVWTGRTAYKSSKAALNSYTIALAHELQEEGIKVNAVSPGFTATKLTKYAGKTANEGAEVLLPWALLEKDGPTGRFIGDTQEELPW